MVVRAKRPDTSEAAIFARLWDADQNGLTPEIARHVAGLRFSAQDTERMHELAAKNRDGSITAAEQEELDNYVRVGDLLAILQSKARKALKKPTRKPS